MVFLRRHSGVHFKACAIIKEDLGAEENPPQYSFLGLALQTSKKDLTMYGLYNSDVSLKAPDWESGELAAKKLMVWDKYVTSHLQTRGSLTSLPSQAQE